MLMLIRSWLTLPVKQHLGQTIRGTRIADTRALHRHAKTVTANYGRAPGYRRWIDEVGLDVIHTRVVALTSWLLERLQQLKHANGRLANTFGVVYLVLILLAAVLAVPLLILTGAGQG